VVETTTTAMINNAPGLTAPRRAEELLKAHLLHEQETMKTQDYIRDLRDK
jgi:hypothetical protein